MLEILAPAGNAECAAAAIHNGANAIYLGYSAFSARQSAENFDGAALRTVIQRAHLQGVKVYVAMNTIVKDAETQAFLDTLVAVWGMGADAIIMQDALLGKAVHARFPEIVLHLSTQAGVCTLEGAKFAKGCGFSRVILARETPLLEIKKIAAFMETEAFVQGALCTCFSGQCYFSSFAGGNSGNRGRCKQPCRKLYSYDRNGFERKSYALSLSDLCVGEDVEKLIEAGVVSFKIEGRMRRAEYVAAAVRYYRKLLDKQTEGISGALSDLKRTYNRGNFTKGLAFGQDKRLLSTAIQGHIGEKVGVVKVVNGKFFVESVFRPKQGDAFKILRDGKEVGGATFSKIEGRGFTLFSKLRLKNGDGVFITTDTATNVRLLQTEKHRKVVLNLNFIEGAYAKINCEDFSFVSSELLRSAQNRALTENELKECFLKTDGLPFDVVFSEIILQGNIFIQKSALNQLRRDFYAAYIEKIGENEHTMYAMNEVFSKYTKTGTNDKTAVIATDFVDLETDIAIYKPNDYNASLPQDFINATCEKYLYYPPFVTSTDLEALKKRLTECKIDGIYAENYGALIFAKENRLKVFVGTGLHMINGISLQELLKDESVAYYAISKEANAQEMAGLVGEKAFVLSSGGIKLMDLCYCPFGKTCAKCDKKELYRLTDENGRVFPVRRYLSSENTCRFEVYNCAYLVGKGIKDAGFLLDLTTVQEKESAVVYKEDEQKQKELYESYTSGHFRRGVL